jgi:chemotaxis protein methyltransferase CheR
MRMKPETTPGREDCAAFLRWALPRSGYDWPGFRKVAKTLCKRLRRRTCALGLRNLDAYRALLETSPDEWRAFDAACRIPISRFARDREVFALLRSRILPALCAAARERGQGALACWSAGCAMGQEPYSLALLWREGLSERFPDLDLRIVATDVDEANLARARAGRYRAEALRGVPEPWRAQGFVQAGGFAQAGGFVQAGDALRVRDEIRARVKFLEQDIRREAPEGPFDLILCRNLVFTYFAADERIRLLGELELRLRPGGALVLGRRERLPCPCDGFRRVDDAPIYLRTGAAADGTRRDRGADR